MPEIVIVKKEIIPHDMSNWGPDAMHNVVGICDCILKDKADGDQVKVTLEGTLVEHDGMRFIAAEKVDGKDVEEMPDMDMANESSEDGEDSQYPKDMNMNSEDALMQFLKNK